MLVVSFEELYASDRALCLFCGNNQLTTVAAIEIVTIILRRLIALESENSAKLRGRRLPIVIPISILTVLFLDFIVHDLLALFKKACRWILIALDGARGVSVSRIVK